MLVLSGSVVGDGVVFGPAMAISSMMDYHQDGYTFKEGHGGQDEYYFDLKSWLPRSSHCICPRLRKMMKA
jgi:hypothetical protein